MCLCLSVLPCRVLCRSWKALGLHIQLHGFIHVCSCVITTLGKDPGSITWGCSRHAPPHRDLLISPSPRTAFHLHTSIIRGRRRQWHPTPVLLPGKSHGQRSLVGCSLWDRDFTFMHWRRKWQPTPVFFPGESQGRGRLVGSLWGRTELDTTEVT